MDSANTLTYLAALDSIAWSMNMSVQFYSNFNTTEDATTPGDAEEGDAAMPDVLALRFVPYTLLAGVCFCLNLFSLLAMLETGRGHRKVRVCF